jgi:putative salt-induced outer membrane protein YdiY
MKIEKHYTQIITALACSIAISSVSAQSAPAPAAPPAPTPPPAKTNLWDFTAAAGLTLTRGNSETMLGVLTVNGKRKTDKNEVLVGAAGAYGETEVKSKRRNPNTTPGAPAFLHETDTEKTAESISAFGQYNHSISERWYAGVRLDFLHDGVANLDYRFTLSPLVGYYAIKQKATTLKFEAGPSLVVEQQETADGGTENDEYLALRLGERFEHQFTPKAKIWQSLEYIPQVDRTGNYLLIAEVGAEAALTERFSLRAVLQDNYDNEPAAGRKNNDVKLITALAYKF